ncbi:MAG: iron-containing alcohol dehydrogenase, partial [Clostridia bacterium]|nr:iron-containing alcohol dehydrogenase [Clostridia bacterium]
MNEFNFYNPTKLIFGRKSIENIGKIAREYGSRCLIVTRPSKSGFAKTIERIDGILKAEGIDTCIYDGVVANPTVDSIDEGARVGREFHPDFVLGVGGGSAMDTAKCVAVGITHEGSIWDYCFFQKTQPTARTLPFLLVSTTSGTGSHVCANAVLTLTEQQHKSGVNGPYLYAKACVIDPELMLSVPEHITASTGFDVFCHAWESYTSIRVNEFSSVFSREAIRIVLETLPKLVNDLNNIELREKMAWADTLAGYALNEAGVTVPHGIGMAIGGVCPHVMHGEALAY